MKRVPPKIENAPGLVMIERRHGWAAKWQCRYDLARRGFKPTKTVICFVGDEVLPQEAAYISDRCQALQSEMLVFGHGGLPKAEPFDGTLRGLINCYQTDEASRYRKLRNPTRCNYDNQLRRLAREHGEKTIAEIRRRDLTIWYDQWCLIGAHTAHGLMSLLRTITTFGSSILEDAQCVRLRLLLKDMRFEMPPHREAIITAEQAVMIRAKAHEMGLHSIALAQAFQFECTFRQKDVIGEWLPDSDPYLSAIRDERRGVKWGRGIRWQEIDHNLVLRHTTSKKLKPVTIRLKNAPMVMEELALLGALPSNGPIIIREKTRLPWQTSSFRDTWRKIARACGIPDEVQNRDTRAGAITEASDSGAMLEDIRHAATHSNVATTQLYSRSSEEKTARVMQLRGANRPKNSV